MSAVSHHAVGLILNSIKIFKKDFRVYLKTGNMTNGEGFSA